VERGEVRELDAGPTDRASDAVEGLVDDSTGQGPAPAAGAQYPYRELGQSIVLT
jgi:hypothetical protein